MVEKDEGSEEMTQILKRFILMEVVNNRQGEEAAFVIPEMFLSTCPRHFSRVPLLDYLFSGF